MGRLLRRGNTVLYLIATTVAMGFLVSACSGDDGQSDEADLESETVATQTTKSDTATTSTSTSTTATAPEAPTTTRPLTDDEIILQIVREYQWDRANRDDRNETEADRAARIAWLEERTVDPILSRVLQAEGDLLEANEFRYGTGQLYNVVEIKHEAPDRVGVLLCNLGLVERHAVDGEIITPPADQFKLIEPRLVKIDGEWFLEDVYSGGDPRCDPVDYWDDRPIVTDETQVEPVLDVHRRFLTETFGVDEAVEGFDRTEELLRELATNNELDYQLSQLDKRRSENTPSTASTFGPNPIAVTIDDYRAKVVDCVVGIDGQPNELMQTFLIRKADTWQVEFFWTDGNQECEPAAS